MFDSIASEKNYNDLEGTDNALGDKTLVDKVEDSRAEILKERKAKDFTSVQLWIAERPFTTAFPDRVIISDVGNTLELLDFFVSFLKDEEDIPGTVLAIEENLLNMTEYLAGEFEIELGHMRNPDQDFDSWTQWSGSKKQVDMIDTPAYFDPLHLPDSSKLTDTILEPPQEREEVYDED